MLDLRSVFLWRIGCWDGPESIRPILQKFKLAKGGAMNKAMIWGLGVLFVVALFIGGCSKPEEKKAEAPAPAAQTEAVTQEAAPAPPAAAGESQPAEVAAPAEAPTEAPAPADETVVEKAAGMVDEAAEEMKAEGEKAVDTAVEQGEKAVEKVQEEAGKVGQ